MYRDQQWLWRKYWGEELSLRAMAELAECCLRTIVNWMNRYGIPRRPTGRNSPRTQVELFWSRVNQDGDCWEWTGGCDSYGYGVMWFDGWDQKAHRVMWQLTYGEIPEGKCVLHKCDNPPCVNPRHLFVGTNQDNIDDREAKGRGGQHKRRGENNVNSKRTWAEVRKMRALYATGEWTQEQIAEKFGIRQTDVSRIIRCDSWKE